MSFVVVLAAVGFTAFLLASSFTGLVQAGILQGGPELVRVPEVVGERETDATQMLTEADLVPVVEIVQNVEVPQGEVISQAPLAGERVLSGASVEVVVSAGDGFTRVPDLRGSPSHELFLMLAAHGLAIGEVTEEVNDLVAAGEVIRHDPARGELLLYGSPVDIVVSTGPPMIEVPDVRGESEAEAIRIIDQAGFDPQVRSRPSGWISRGDAVSTDPRAGEEAARGSVVIVYVSTGAPPTTAPPTTEPPATPPPTSAPPTTEPDDARPEAEPADTGGASGPDEIISP